VGVESLGVGVGSCVGLGGNPQWVPCGCGKLVGGLEGQFVRWCLCLLCFLFSLLIL